MTLRLIALLLTAQPGHAAQADASALSEAVLSERWGEGLGVVAEGRRRGMAIAALGFFPRARTPRASPGLERSFDAVVELDFGGSSRCAGVYISKSGYILTAAHCFRDHLTKASRFSAADLSVIEHPQGAVLYEKIVPELDVEGESAVLVAAGRGVLSHLYSPPDMGRISGEAGLIERLGAAAAGDWVILRTRRSSPAPCVSARSAALGDGEPVWAAGYPGPVARPGGLGSDGSGLRITFGEKSSDVASSRWLETVDPLSREVFRRIYQPRVSAGEIIFSGVDSYGGMSGGPLLDEDGRLIGVLTASGHTQRRFFDTSTIGISVQHVIKEMARHEIDPSKFFDCGTK